MSMDLGYEKFDIDEIPLSMRNKYYGVFNDIQLIGKPVPVSYREMAKGPRSEYLSSIEELSDPTFYLDNFQKKTVEEALKKVTPSSPEIVIVSDVNITNVVDNVFVFAADFANYEQAVQFAIPGEGFSIRDGKAYRYNQEIGVMAEDMTEAPTGLADVSIFSVGVNFRKYFATPVTMREFDGDFITQTTAKLIYNEHFKEGVIERAKEIQDAKGIEIKGVLVSNIVENSRLSDNIMNITSSPEGEFLLAVSYLV